MLHETYVILANSIWPEPELLGLVDDLTGRTGRNL